MNNRFLRNNDNQIFKSFGTELEKVKEKFKSISIPKIETPKIKVNYNKWMIAGKNIGKNGWTIPLSITPRAMVYLGDSKHSIEELDRIMTEYYTHDNNVYFNEMINSILSSDEISSWKEAISQCEKAYYDKLYILIVNTLIPILEGLLSKFEEDKNNIRMIKVCQKMLDQSINSGKKVHEAIWISCLHFIKMLYEKSDFSKVEPRFINRHWILHGRTSMNWDRQDVLRLFNAISTVLSIIEMDKTKD